MALSTEGTDGDQPLPDHPKQKVNINNRQPRTPLTRPENDQG
jgi:hypothetical protein